MKSSSYLFNHLPLLPESPKGVFLLFLDFVVLVAFLLKTERVKLAVKAGLDFSDSIALETPDPSPTLYSSSLTRRLW